MDIKMQNISLLDDLNDHQKEAVQYFKSNLRIIAGAGSGKTKVLTRKVAYLINDLAIPPHDILAVTFTNKACNEMSERIRQYCGDLTSELKIKTFHSLCAEILRIEAKNLKIKSDFQIIDETDKKMLLQEIFKKLEISQSQISYSAMIRYISWAKNNKYSPKEMAYNLKNDEDNETIPKIYALYNRELKRKEILDFDDLIIKVEELFSTNEEIRDKWSKKFQFVLVDEFQDTSYLQYKIIKTLVGPNTHLTIVGDPDQTIYHWRGADVDLILNFENDYPNSKTIVLDTNYRSTKTILRAANKLIQNNHNRFNKDLHTPNPEGLEIEFFHAFNMEAEARWVVQKINELKKQKIQLKNIAILYRSNWYSQALEEALINENINHKIFNGVKFYQRSEIKDALAFLRVLYDGSDISFERIINVPSRGIGAVTLNALKKYANEVNMTLYAACVKNIKKLPIPESVIVKSLYPFLKTVIKYKKALKEFKISVVLKNFLDEIGFMKDIEDKSNLRGTAVENVKELLRSIETWEEKNPDKGVSDYLEMVSLLSAGDEYDNFTNYVSLMTVHSSKGLEFDNVFVVGMSEKIFPSHKGFKDPRDNSWLEEERRLAYVAITRAKQRLFISDSRGYLIGTNIEKEPSRFIEEMGIDLDKFIIVQPNAINENDEELSITNDDIIAGDVVSHTIFGEGTVLKVIGSDILVSFIRDGKERTLRKNHPAIKVISK
ncbi:UvrD-helicase domain-containing protein [Mycoplasmopsis ciconiae]|uniref:DNA 3'-5' helicase n=1 Tax=Mycoplasmopsis ciconiae TaxID=561067 RepID=A0ABU7MN99_9BACT|nr:UvrD-helicase domain-containing protein [Mycoplasmopsis ciconiae]